MVACLALLGGINHSYPEAGGGPCTAEVRGSKLEAKDGDVVQLSVFALQTRLDCLWFRSYINSQEKQVALHIK